MPTPTPTPTPTSNPYGPKVITVDPKPLQPNAAVPMSINPSDAARNNVLQAEQQNAAIAAASGKAGGSRTLKRSNKGKRSSKRSNKGKRSSKRSNKGKRSSKRSKRSRRGGAATPTTTTPTPKPTATVPQFGSQHPGANLASAQLNSGGMNQSAQAQFDNPNAPATTTYLQ